MLAPADFNWRTFRREGDAYLCRLGLSDAVALYAVATLYVREFNEFRRGNTWNAKRFRWESERCRTRSYQSCLGVKMSEDWRGKLAVSWAAVHGETAARWTPALESALLTLRRQGASYRQIAKKMGKTKAAIQARVRYLQLGRRLRVPESGHGA